ncbi:MAG: HD domain-containing protein [Candidatus Peribacteria bacterium]|nr:MAG: HD domain-containing protein [Candidatus Peribacteria bacterium]
MSHSIQDIYTQYQIPPSLQEHMLRVAAVAEQICLHSSQEIDHATIVTAALLHDMGNIIKFNLDKLPE